MSRGYLKTLEAFLAVTILLFILYQFQINIPPELPKDIGNTRLKAIAEDIKNIYCYSTESREYAIDENELLSIDFKIPSDIDYNISLFDENWNLLDSIGNYTNSEKVSTACIITGYLHGIREGYGIRYIKIEVWYR